VLTNKFRTGTAEAPFSAAPCESFAVLAAIQLKAGLVRRIQGKVHSFFAFGENGGESRVRSILFQAPQGGCENAEAGFGRTTQK